MEGKRIGSRQSSLPSSLIPHLYTGPQDGADGSDTTSFGVTPPLPATAGISERTSTERASLTLPPMVPSLSANPTRDEFRNNPQYSSYGPISPTSPDHILNARAPSPAERSGSATIDRSLTSLSITSHVPGQRYASPIYSDPIYHTPQPQRFSHGTSTYSLPASQDIGSSHGSWREGEAGPSSLVYPAARHEQGRNRGSSQPAERVLPRIETGYLRHGEEEGTGSAIPAEFSYSARSHIPSRGSERSSPHLLGGTPRNPYTLQTWSGATLPVGSGGSPTDYSPSPISEMAREPQPDDEVADDSNILHKGKKRQRDSDQRDNSSRKNQNSRKTAVACNFCRGRKLRCNGAKPSCHNCTVRKFQCEYVPVQRRRGPGKAPKGTKTKKGHSTTLPPIEHSASHPIQESPHAPEDLPQMSVISLDNFSFQPPDPSPHYPSSSRSRRRGNTSRPPSGLETDPDTDTRY